MEVQYLDNITKKNYLCSRNGGGENFELGGTSETSGTGGSASRTSDCGTGGTGGTGETGERSRKVYAKEVAKYIYEELNKPTNVEETLKILAEKMNNNQFTE